MPPTSPSPVIRTWNIHCHTKSAGPALPFRGWEVREALATALRHSTCTADCGPGPCNVGPGCPVHDLLEPVDGPPPFRLDVSDLDGRDLAPGTPWTARLTSFDDAAGDLLIPPLVQGLVAGVGPEGLAHDVVGTDRTEPLDLVSRAMDLGPRLLVSLRSPSQLLRNGLWQKQPSVGDLLHAALHRSRALGLDVQGLPRFTPEVASFALSREIVEGVHWSRPSGTWIPYRGVRATWIVEPTPAQGIWLALAEAVGVGKGTAGGMGVLRLSPAPDTLRLPAVDPADSTDE